MKGIERHRKPCDFSCRERTQLCCLLSTRPRSKIILNPRNAIQRLPEMEEASNQGNPPPPKQETSGEKQLAMNSTTYFHFQPLTPIWRLSPCNSGSTLYDSYELRAVSHQLNRALQGSQAPPSLYFHPSNSPFHNPYRRCLDHMYRENAKTPKRITGSQLVGETVDAKPSSQSTRGFIPQLWKKLKRTFLRSKKP